MTFFRKSIFFSPVAAALMLAASPLCRAQDLPKDPSPFTLFTASIGGSKALIGGSDGKLMDGQWGFQAGAGYRVKQWWPKAHYPNGDPDGPSRASFYINGNFQYDQSKIKSSAVTQAVNANPQNPAILSAITGQGKFYTATLDPTLRFAPNDRLGIYGLAGFGLLRRTIDLTGPATEGNLIQPVTESVFGSAGNSGVLAVGGGVDYRVWKEMKIYVEGRALHGFGVNSGTTLWPISAGVRW
jgi:opacity protein-like surface antigen